MQPAWEPFYFCWSCCWMAGDCPASEEVADFVLDAVNVVCGTFVSSAIVLYEVPLGAMLLSAIVVLRNGYCAQLLFCGVAGMVQVVVRNGS